MAGSWGSTSLRAGWPQPGRHRRAVLPARHPARSRRPTPPPRVASKPSRQPSWNARLRNNIRTNVRIG